MGMMMMGIETAVADVKYCRQKQSPMACWGVDDGLGDVAAASRCRQIAAIVQSSWLKHPLSVLVLFLTCVSHNWASDWAHIVWCRFLALCVWHGRLIGPLAINLARTDCYAAVTAGLCFC
jgi:hypothetical protein